MAGEPFEPASPGRLRPSRPMRPSRPRRPARPGPRSPHPGAAPVRLPPSARAARGVRLVTRRLAACGACAPRSSSLPGGTGRRARPPRGAFGAAGRLGGDRAPARGGEVRQRPGAGGRGSLVRGGAASLAERRHGSAGVGAGGARLRAAVGRRARALPQHAARGHRPAPARFRRSPGGADDPVRAAVEHWQGRHDEAHVRLTRAWDEVPDRSTPAAAALQIELSIDGLYERDFEQTLAMGRGARTAAHALGDEALIAAAVSALCLGEAAVGDIAAAEDTAPRRSSTSTGSRTPSSRAWRRSTTWAGPRTTSSTTTKRSPTPTAESRSRARLVRTPAASPDAGQGLPVRDPGRMTEALEVTEAAVEGRAPVRQPAQPVVGALRACLGALLPGQPRRGGRPLRGEPSGRWPAGGQHDAGGQRRARLATGVGALRARGPRGLEVVEAIGGGDLERHTGRALFLLGGARHGRARSLRPRRGRPLRGSGRGAGRPPRPRASHRPGPAWPGGAAAGERDAAGAAEAAAQSAAESKRSARACPPPTRS